VSVRILAGAVMVHALNSRIQDGPPSSPSVRHAGQTPFEDRKRQPARHCLCAKRMTKSALRSIE
jgi:hypothetical protein